MPQTLFDIDQAEHLPSSGSFVSDEELTNASGSLQYHIDNLGGSIAPIASGLFKSNIYILPAKGEETDSKPRVRYDIPCNEYVKVSDTSTWWTARQAFGVPASGVIFYTAWFVDTTHDEQIQLEVQVKPIEPGDDLIAVSPISHQVAVSGNAGINTMWVTAITVPIDPHRAFFAFKFSRLGTQDNYDDSLFTVAHGIQFLFEVEGYG
jgi:hypothetical protein